MANNTMTKLSSFVFLFLMLANSEATTSTKAEPTIPASPGILPYVTSPDISSFFPNPSEDQPMSSAAPAPAPSSGEFDGKMTSSSARLNYGNAIVVMMLCSFLRVSTIVNA
ncbi:hypothetical protein PIB30_000081 [Stylosanthes scabra]|uniref:Uncharacterized protein n=1 Tax=Stylosanthes scabra TaxID=79078 RepID=A0ABU6Q215_9FABA|nr:hypothetical protein [Stylosanthes scabra]